MNRETASSSRVARRVRLPRILVLAGSGLLLAAAILPASASAASGPKFTFFGFMSGCFLPRWTAQHHH